MGYYLSAFASVNIPIKAGDQDISTDPSVNPMVKLIGGSVYDSMGTDRALAAPDKITCRGIVAGADMHTIQDILDPIRAKRGVSGTLTATMGDATTRTRTARLMEVKARRRSTSKVIDVELVFQCVAPGWNGTANGTPVTIETTPKTITVANGGNRRVTNCIITLVVPVAVTQVTSFTISVSGVSYISFTGTVAANTSLVIDCGARTVLNNGVNAFASFARHATNHIVEDWLRLEPGNNSVIVTIVGGDNVSTVTFGFSDGWE